MNIYPFFLDELNGNLAILPLQLFAVVILASPVRNQESFLPKNLYLSKSDALQTVALNVPRYAATLALYILITQACSDFYNFSSLSYHANITYNKSVRYTLNETSEKRRGR